jgi:hypothetical protein
MLIDVPCGLLFLSFNPETFSIFSVRVSTFTCILVLSVLWFFPFPCGFYKNKIKRIHTDWSVERGEFVVWRLGKWHSHVRPWDWVIIPCDVAEV